MELNSIGFPRVCSLPWIESKVVLEESDWFISIAVGVGMNFINSCAEQVIIVTGTGGYTIRSSSLEVWYWQLKVTTFRVFVNLVYAGSNLVWVTIHIVILY